MLCISAIATGMDYGGFQCCKHAPVVALGWVFFQRKAAFLHAWLVDRCMVAVVAYASMISKLGGLTFGCLCLQELTLNHPNIVNAKKNTELLYSTKTFLQSHK